jgi:hypothetical protein
MCGATPIGLTHFRRTAPLSGQHRVAWKYLFRGAVVAGKPSEPTKEYRARIWVKLSDDFLPHPLLTKAELEARIRAALEVGSPDSPIVSIRVDDPR